jgi:hypothetical protein
VNATFRSALERLIADDPELRLPSAFPAARRSGIRRHACSPVPEGFTTVLASRDCQRSDRSQSKAKPDSKDLADAHDEFNEVTIVTITRFGTHG